MTRVQPVRHGRLHSSLVALGVALAVAGTAHAAPFAYITNQGTNDVSVIDLSSEAVVATLPVGKSPAGVAAAGRNGVVVVPSAVDGSLTLIDDRTQSVRATVREAGQGVVGIATLARGRSVALSDWYGKRLLVYDLIARDQQPPQLAKRREVPLGEAPAGVVASADGRTVYVAERDDNRVARIDVDTGATVRVGVGRHPFALLLDEERHRLIALNVESDDMTVVDTRQMQAVKTLATGEAPYGATLAQDGRLLYVTNQHDDTVSVYDAETLQPLRTLKGFGYPEGIAAWRDKVYVVNWADDQVSVLDAASGRLLRQIATGSNPRAFGPFIAADR